MAGTVEVALRWRGEEAAEVAVAGEWTDWKPLPLVKEADGGWVLRPRLLPGRYQYKWVVDGEWQVSRDLPVVADAAGIENNQLEVEAEGGQDSGDSDSWEKVMSTSLRPRLSCR
jgi:hypothetical protein